MTTTTTLAPLPLPLPPRQSCSRPRPHAPLTQIVGLASISLRGEKSADREKAAVLALLAKVRAKPLLRDVQMVVVIESQMGIAASHISNYFVDEPNVTIMFECSGGREGVPKSDATTSLMKTETELLLNQNRVRFSSDLVTHTTNPDKPSTPTQEREKLFRQLANLRYEPLPRKNDTDEQRYKITGKSPSQPDDLLIATMQCFFWSRRFWTSPAERYAAAKAYIAARMGHSAA